MKTVFRSSSLLLALSLILLALTACNLGASASPTDPPPVDEPTAEVAAPVEPTTSAVSTAIVCFPGIVPGQTTRDEVIAVLGEPDGINPAGEEMPASLESLAYPSSVEGLNDVVLLQDGKVLLAGKGLDSDSLTVRKVKELYGEPEQITFSYFMMEALTYLYPSKGLSFIVQPEGDLVLYQQCVAPMPLEQYMSTWGASLPLEDPYTE